MTTGTNDNEDPMSSTLNTTVSPETNNDLLFRSPSLTMSLRGRKRKTTYAEDFDYSASFTVFFNFKK